MKKMKRFLAVCITAVLSLAAAGCAGKDVDEKPEGGSAAVSEAKAGNTEGKDTLTIAYDTDPEGLDPHRTVAASTFSVTNNIYDTLLGVTSDWEVYPRLAQDYQLSSDGHAITFQLRQGVLFHNGREVKAEDVKYSFDRLMGEDSPKAKDYENISSIEVLGDYEIRFTTEALDVELVKTFTYPWTAIVPEEEADNLKTKPVGTGPYKFVEWIPQQQVVLERNENYYGEPAKIENVVFKLIPDATSRLAGLQVGDLDIVEVTGDQIDVLDSSEPFQVYTEAMNAVQIMALNTDNEILSKEKVRQAIAMAINKDEIIDAVVWGHGDKIGSHLPIKSPDYVDANDIMPYDPEKAKELLKEAGYENGFTLKLTLPQNYQIHVDTGMIIADQLGKIGITVEPEIVTWSNWVSEVYTNKNFEATVVAHTGRLDSHDFLERYYSDSDDYISLKTGEADALLDEAVKETDEAKRKELYAPIQKILAEKLPAIYIHTPHKLYGMAKNVEGFRIYPIDIFELKDVYFSE